MLNSSKKCYLCTFPNQFQLSFLEPIPIKLLSKLHKTDLVALCHDLHLASSSGQFTMFILLEQLTSVTVVHSLLVQMFSSLAFQYNTFSWFSSYHTSALSQPLRLYPPPLLDFNNWKAPGLSLQIFFLLHLHSVPHYYIKSCGFK